MNHGIKAAERPTRPQPLYNMHNETVNNRRLYVQIVQIFTDTPIFKKVNTRITLFFHQQNFDFTDKNLPPHRQHYSFPENKSFSKKNCHSPRFWQNTNIGFSSFLKTEMTKLLILVFASYAIAILLLTKYVDYRKMRTTF